MDERKISKGYYESVRRILFMCRIVGYLPIIGLLNEKSKLSRCVWISTYSIYNAMSMLSLISFFCIHIYYVWYAIGFRDLGGLLLQGFAIAATVFLIRFCSRWETMIKEIENIERLLPSLKNPERIFKNITYCTYFFLTLCIVAIVMSSILSIRIIVLYHIKDDTFSLAVYYNAFYKWVFNIIDFNYVTVFFLEVSKVQMAFAYIFIDSIVVIVTLYLIYRFQNFNRMVRTKQMMCLKNKNVLWMDLQAHYTRLTRLVKIIDDHINSYVFLSFLSNLIFICKYIYDIFQLSEWLFRNSDWIVILNYVANITFLVLKMSAVSILSAHLHTLSREPLKLLHTLPDSAYTFEVQRFMDQVYHSKVHLSGFGFFYISRATILSMLSTIITYELVLLQLPVIYRES